VADGQRRRRRATPPERREERAAVEDVSVVLEAAARFLEARPRAVAEVRRRLAQAGYRAALVETAVGRLVELGFLDDESFARAWVDSRDRAHPRGERALRLELARKGVDREVVDAVLAERQAVPVRVDPDRPDRAAPGADEVAAGRLLERRLAQILREPDPRRRRQRAYGLLARSGFDPDVCASVVHRYLDAVDGDPRT
jgi:regulatory protein